MFSQPDEENTKELIVFKRPRNSLPIYQSIWLQNDSRKSWIFGVFRILRECMGVIACWYMYERREVSRWIDIFSFWLTWCRISEHKRTLPTSLFSMTMLDLIKPAMSLFLLQNGILTWTKSLMYSPDCNYPRACCFHTLQSSLIGEHFFNCLDA